MTKRKPGRPPKNRLMAAPPPVETPAIPIFDLMGSRLIGRVLEEKPDSFLLSWPALLDITPTPSTDGLPIAGYKVRAVSPFTAGSNRTYRVFKSALRGLSHSNEKWLRELYEQYVTACESGVFNTVPLEAHVQHGRAVPAAAQPEVPEEVPLVPPAESHPAVMQEGA